MATNEKRTPEFIPTPDPISTAIVFGAEVIGGFIAGLFGAGSTAQVEAQLNQMRTAFSEAIDTLKRFAWTIAFGLGALLQAIHDIWVTFLDGLWDLVKRAWKKIEKIVTDILPKIVDLMRKFRAWWNDIYKRFIRPALNWIQIARKYLAILRIFHVKWAAKLDNILLQVEGKIIAPYLYVLRSLNGIGQWVNVIITAKGVIQKPLFLNSMYAYQRDWINLWWQGQAAAPGVVSPPSSPAAQLPPAPAEVQASFAELQTTNTGTYAQPAARGQAAFDSIVRSV